jgi:hypothetical protein
MFSQYMYIYIYICINCTQLLVERTDIIVQTISTNIFLIFSMLLLQ